MVFFVANVKNGAVARITDGNLDDHDEDMTKIHTNTITFESKVSIGQKFFIIDAQKLNFFDEN